MPANFAKSTNSSGLIGGPFVISKFVVNYLKIYQEKL